VELKTLHKAEADLAVEYFHTRAVEENLPQKKQGKETKAKKDNNESENKYRVNAKCCQTMIFLYFSIISMNSLSFSYQ
jgi:hypothetical protein